ncbi:hypothetical protein [Streptomyces sp. NRRL F-5053]|uniref:hypothetical protein n=1 Tax=Streptomyces sp. NRRL F-5053 TaxID=1463854 RepID=UPI0004CA22BA|nr:hypothetical protein [Streptomyces sp. NRRL F-5053]
MTALRATKLTRIAATTATATGAAAIALTTLGTGTAHATEHTTPADKPLAVHTGNSAQALHKQAQDAKKDKSDDAKSAGKAKSGKDAHNIVAACNYAADRYGSMDNVDSAY